MTTASLLENLSELCNHHLGPNKRSHRIQPNISRCEAKSRLKSVAFNALFNYLKDPPCQDDSVLQNVDCIQLEIFKLRQLKKFEVADRLEYLYSNLKAKDDVDEPNQVLRFLIALKDTGQKDSTPTPLMPFQYPSKQRGKIPDISLDGPLSYGDSRLTSGYSHYYVHYPKELFEQIFPTIEKSEESIYSKVFGSLPGECLEGDQTFAHQLSLGTSHEIDTHISLFGGLTQSLTTGLNMTLDLPDLTDSPQFRIPEFKCKKSVSSSQLSEESGLGSGGESVSGSITNLPDDNEVDDSLIWEKTLTETRSLHYTWEWIGYQPGLTERPYLTEAGPETYDIVIRLRHRVCSMLLESSPETFTTVDTTTLTKYVLYMLNGVPSVYFPYDESSQKFDILPGLHTVGFSPELLSNFLSEFAECGTYHVRLTQFSQAMVLNSFYKEGLLFQAFLSAIRKFLKYFTAEVLNAPKQLQLIQLKVYFHKAMTQIRYLAKLCQCHGQPPQSVIPSDFPTGMKLISYLYKEASVAISSPHYTALLSILQTTCAPFILFIRDWVFHGVFTDCFNEFMITADHSCIEIRDDSYWDKAYQLLTGDGNDGEIPEFLQDMAQDIVTCGKSINLLRICNPKHFMCNLLESELPSVSLSLSKSDLAATEKFCDVYAGKMRELARQFGENRAEMLQRLEQEKLELQQTARQIADAEIARLQGIIDDRRKKAEEKKAIERKRLKQQMEDDLKRRADEVEEMKEEDRRYISRLNREEDALTQQEIELEMKTRDDLIAYYTELGEEAMHRERKALWRVRRAQLREARHTFLNADDEKWSREMAEAQQAQNILDSVESSDLPHWVSKVSTTNEVLEVRDDEENAGLPSWARNQLPSNIDDTERDSNTNQNVVELENNNELPAWVRQAAEEESVTMKVVDDTDIIADETESELVTELDKNVRIIGGKSLPKPQVHSSEGYHISLETTESHHNPHIHAVEGKRISDMSTTVAVKPHLKTVKNSNILKESEAKSEKSHIKSSATMSATKESESHSDEGRHHLKFSDSIKVNQQSAEERELIPRLHTSRGLHSITEQTQSDEWVVKKQSLFGHVSQLSNTDYHSSVPRLRRVQMKRANTESDFKDFSIKPKIRISSKMSVNRESDSTEFRPSVRVDAHHHVSVESDQVDRHSVAVDRFKSRNDKGHTSDSSIQRLLYGEKTVEKKTTEPIPRIKLKPGLPHQPDLYQTENFGFDLEPEVDLMSNIQVVDLGRGLIEQYIPSESEVEVTKYMPLSVLLSKSLTMPIKAQISLVNKAVLNYFTSELKVDDHLAAIRRYLLMSDGDFAEFLSDILLEKLSTNPLPQEILNSVFLNGALTKAIRSSIHSDDDYSQNLSFAARYMPNVLTPNDPRSLNCLELRYKVDWPLNIIITKACMEMYYKIFSFLLQIKRMVWVLKDIWNRLKRDAAINKVGNCTEFRNLQFHRQEMEHFVQMMQGYITTQVIHVSWKEFQSALTSPSAGIDQLHNLHHKYVSNALNRCLLTKKTEKVMKFIQDIFCFILKFRSQLITGSWQHDDQGQVTHSNFSSMLTTYKSFHTYSFFLFKVVNRLSQKGYQPHLQELLLQLNFNDYYSEVSH